MTIKRSITFLHRKDFPSISCEHEQSTASRKEENGKSEAEEVHEAMSSSDAETISQYVIYDCHSDFPDHFVVRNGESWTPG
jgi:hypothetical protein